MKSYLKTSTAGSFFLFIIFLSISARGMAQADCSVLSEKLKGSYSGECKKGKANGSGKAVGTDSYEGSFKNGYPDGEGIYTYASGNFYKGNFKKGMLHGEGEFHYIISPEKDSTVKGFWEDDHYKGEYDKPYILLYKSPGIVRLNIRESTGGLLQSNIRITSVLLIKATIMVGALYPDPVTLIRYTRGLYDRETKEMSEKKAVTTLQNVTFPFKAVIELNEHYFEIQLNKNCNWDIELELGKP